MSMSENKQAELIAPLTPGNPPAFWQAILPVVALIGLLVINVILYSDNASYGPNQIALLFSAVLAGAMGYMNCLLYTSPSPRDLSTSRMPSSA